MATLLFIDKPGDYGNLDLTGTDRSKDIGIKVFVPSGKEVNLGHVTIHNTFIPLIKWGSGLLHWESLTLTGFGGDALNVRGSNLIGDTLEVYDNTPALPYSVCVREGQESIVECLVRNNEEVYDPSLLSFGSHPSYPGKEIIPAAHVDGIVQLYCTKEDGYTKDPTGTLENIQLPRVTARLSGSKTQGVMASELNRYTNMHIGTVVWDVVMDGYPYSAVFNQLDSSEIATGKSTGFTANEIRVSHAKPTSFKSFNNLIGPLENRSSTMQLTAQELHNVKIQRWLCWLTLYQGKLDGKVGRKTQAAYTEFAESRGITTDVETALEHQIKGFDLPDFQGKSGLAFAVKALCIHLGKTSNVYPSYIMATIQHETAGQFAPIEEYGKGRNHSYGQPDKKTGQCYFGRGYVQLTHDYNYRKYSAILGVDLLNHPDRAMNKYFSLFILVHGMLTGAFTGKSMDAYINDAGKPDLTEIRRTVNGPRSVGGQPDKADVIAGYYTNIWSQFYEQHFATN